MTNSMKVVYVSGPFRASNAWETWQHVNRAAVMALEVWRAGAACVCPHLNTFCFQGAADDDVWLQGDLEMLRRCDAVLMIDGWEWSVGARHERTFAIGLKLPVFYSLDRKSTRLNSSHIQKSRMPSSA